MGQITALIEPSVLIILQNIRFEFIYVRGDQTFAQETYPEVKIIRTFGKVFIISR